MTIHSSGSVWAPFVRRAAIEVDGLPFRGSGWTSTYPGHGEIYPGRAGEGNRGQYAVDFMITNKAAGDAIAAYLVKNAVRLGIRYVIWYRRIWSRTGPTPGKWRAYVNPVPSKRGTASGDHTNHPHASFFSDDRSTTTTEPAPAPGIEGHYMERIKKADALHQPLAVGENAVKLNKDGDLSVVSTPRKDVDVTALLRVEDEEGKLADPSSYALAWRTVKFDETPKPKNKPTTVVNQDDEILIVGSNQARYAGAVGSVADPFSLRLRLVLVAYVPGLVLASYRMDGWTS